MAHGVRNPDESPSAYRAWTGGLSDAALAAYVREALHSGRAISKPAQYAIGELLRRFEDR